MFPRKQREPFLIAPNLFSLGNISSRQTLSRREKVVNSSKLIKRNYFSNTKKVHDLGVVTSSQ